MDSVQKHNALNQGCPSRQALDLIADKWTILAIYALSCGPKRYSELLNKIEGVSKKMLTQTLRDLEFNGLVQRQVYPVIPPMVEYSLTDMGKTLLDATFLLKSWAETHIDEVIVARTRYETVKASSPSQALETTPA